MKISSCRLYFKYFIFIPKKRKISSTTYIGTYTYTYIWNYVKKKCRYMKQNVKNKKACGTSMLPNKNQTFKYISKFISNNLEVDLKFNKHFSISQIWNLYDLLIANFQKLTLLYICIWRQNSFFGQKLFLSTPDIYII